MLERNPGSMKAKVLDCGLKVNQFELHSYIYVHIPIKTFNFNANYEGNSVPAVLLQG